MARGRFITLEGGEGAGKSTQAKLLGTWLVAPERVAVLTREPGGSPGAEQIRALLVEGETDRWDPIAEALLHYAARRDHLRRTIEPELALGRWVVCDRFIDSTMAYQGYGHGLDRDFIRGLERAVIGDLRPDLTLILDLPVELGLKRAAERHGTEARYEAMDRAFHERLRAGYRAIAAAEPDRCVLIDADAEPMLVQRRIRDAVRMHFPADFAA
jgi:dTMP kinase